MDTLGLIPPSSPQQKEPTLFVLPPAAEGVNAISRNRGLQQFLVRGLEKARTAVLWFAIAQNLMQAVALRATAALPAVEA